MLTGVDFLASPCVPSPISAIRTPGLPLLPVWEKGAGGMREIVHETPHLTTSGRYVRDPVMPLQKPPVSV
jgi:hypothetical protein